jgi:ABC-type nitrate/sulfonate/bicarbonate transport system permease component
MPRSTGASDWVARPAGEEAETGAPFSAVRRRDRLGDLVWPLGIGVGAFLLWEALCRGLGVRPILLPPPSAIFVTMVTRGDLLFDNLWPSVCQTILAFLLSVTGGVLLAILITYSKVVRKGFYPIIVVSQVVPKISIAPLFIVWFGTGAASSLLLAFLVSFFPMTINATIGFRIVNERSSQWRAASWVRAGRSSARSGCRMPSRTYSAA